MAHLSVFFSPDRVLQKKKSSTPADSGVADWENQRAAHAAIHGLGRLALEGVLGSRDGQVDLDISLQLALS
jgi:hypothetical protein